MSKTQRVETFADLDNPESQIEELIKRNWWSSVPLTSFPASWLSNGEQRLDGRFYANESFQALLVLQKSQLPIKNLASLVEETFVCGRFKRVYATDKDAGWPYLSASEALMFRPESDRYLAKEHAPKGAESHFAKEGWILLSCSGTVGRSVIASKRLEKFFLTHDLIRIVPDEDIPVGYLYAYLSSWVGQALISKDQYGSAIKHVEPHHIDKIPVPLVDDSIQEKAHQNIMKAFQLRDEANELLDEADKLLHQSLGLPQFDEDLIDYFESPQQLDGEHIPAPKSFILNTSDLDDRFDGSYHVPVSRTAVKLVKQANYEAVSLGSIISDVFHPPRFPRTYVDEAYGVPFLQGSHLPHLRPYDLKYISKTVNEKQAKQCLLEPNWILVTRSGTIGRLGLVPKQATEWAASEHMIRIVAEKDVGHPGYIMAFLATPYGQHQLKAKIYGAVVDELTEADTEAVWMPKAPYEVQEKIGSKVVEAYEKKELANQIEAKAIRELERILEGKGMEEETTQPTEQQDIEPQIEWAFEPTLGYEIEPTITKGEFENLLERLAKPQSKPSDPKKKGTSA